MVAFVVQLISPAMIKNEDFVYTQKIVCISSKWRHVFETFRAFVFSDTTSTVQVSSDGRRWVGEPNGGRQMGQEVCRELSRDSRRH